MSRLKTDKLLAEWLWIDRWDGSSASLLPIEPRGLYREMLTQAWRRGAALPNDHEAIQRAVRCTPAEWARCWPKIERFWRVDGDRIVNDTQLAVYAEALQAKDRASERGRKGAQATAQARAQAPAQAAREHSHKYQPPSPSPSPSPLSTLGVGREVVASSRPDPPTRPPASPFPEQRAEDATAAEIRRLQNELGKRLARLAEHPNSREMVPAWCRKVTAYTNKQGAKVQGAADYRTVYSIDRLERSIQDADWWVAKLDAIKPGGASLGPRV